MLAKLHASATKQVGVDYQLLSDVYALGARITLYASPPVDAAARNAIRHIVGVATGPELSDDDVRGLIDEPDSDVIMVFADACRSELRAMR